MEATVRTAVEGDLDRLVDIWWAAAAEGGLIGREVPFDRLVLRQSMAQRLGVEHATVLVVPDGPSEVVGGLTIAVAPYGTAELSMVLADGHRGRGHGTALLAAAVAWAGAAGAHKMSLEVWPGNDAALALYHRAGFVEEGLLRRHYRRRNGELWDSIVMGLLLT